jgi:hypothetical protein
MLLRKKKLSPARAARPMRRRVQAIASPGTLEAMNRMAKALERIAAAMVANPGGDDTDEDDEEWDEDDDEPGS